MLALLFSMGRANAVTLEHMKRMCEQLESYWQRDPPTEDGAHVPDQPGAAICYGYMSAVSDLTMLVGGLGVQNMANCYLTPQGKLSGGANCRPTLGICIPKGVSIGQVLAVFLAYARSHVAQWHEGAWTHYLLAMHAAFPCKDEYLTPP